MRLFYKTLLFFVGVIAFQSALTILLVSGLTRRSNLAEARRELADEAAIIYESFNSWKRQLWASLIAIGNDRRLARSLDPSAASSPRLQEAILVAKVDCLILKRPGAQILEVLPSGYLTFTAADLGALQRVKPHPYLELRILHGTLCLVGVTIIPLSGSRHLEAYLVKRLDQEFCAQLTLNRKSRVVLLLGQRELAGSGPPPAPAFDPRAMPSSYLERYNQRLGGERLNLAFQRIGRLEQEEQGEELFLGTFLSNEPYNRRILQAGQGVLLISAAGALATCLLSLYLSRNITHPIAELLAGMERLKAGAYDTRVGARGGYEIQRLFGGFNDMAEKLAGSRAALQDNLQETVLLKEYNEKIINSIQAGHRHRRPRPAGGKGQPGLPGLLRPGRPAGARSAAGIPGHRPVGHPAPGKDPLDPQRAAGQLRRGQALRRRAGLRDQAVSLLQPRGRAPAGLRLHPDGRRRQRQDRAGAEDLPGRETVLHQHALGRHGPRDQQPPRARS